MCLYSGSTIARKLEHLGGQVLQDGSRVDGSGGADAALGGDSVLQEAVDAADGELQGGRRQQGQTRIPVAELRVACVVRGVCV